MLREYIVLYITQPLELNTTQPLELKYIIEHRIHPLWKTSWPIKTHYYRILNKSPIKLLAAVNRLSNNTKK